MSINSQYLRKAGGQTVVLDGDAVIGDVLTGKTFYNTDPNTKLTGTAVFQTGDIKILDPLQATIELETSWNAISWITEHNMSIEKSWTA